ncbi:MAG TPA: right-handed parallel beta-helix repeat-containing protein [Thermoanaerobaculia bacterium]|nr:right-handed parallel beta-helix repeat-containing protein [Thermoanaerobaculia bacterium]HUM31237.1 right-handed parallel beta-helix repeat-containing protein [Thermoanaerobaculia bacterium]HXK69591.1 right-handed parallel beta-helix repeat-containing protein [Thermoanaerobaculia bacterium]
MQNHGIFLMVMLLFAGSMFADEGRIPLYQSGTISASGSYVVTRDITSSGTVFWISADNVTLDLNGFTLTNSTTSNGVVSISSGKKNIRIEDGTLVGGASGIYHLAFDTDFCSITVDNLDIATTETGISVQNLERINIYRTRIRPVTAANLTGYGISLLCPECDFVANIEDNSVRNAGLSGIYADGMAAGRIVANQIKWFNTNWSGIAVMSNVVVVGSIVISENSVFNNGGGFGIAVNTHGGNLISRNTIQGTNYGIQVDKGASLVEDNVLSEIDDYGITIFNPGCTVRNNRVRGMLLSNSRGISLYSNYDLAEGNSVSNFVTGIYCSNSTSYYRNNFLHGNTTPATGGTNGGGNLP